jgi:hypothetical protein
LKQNHPYKSTTTPLIPWALPEEGGSLQLTIAIKSEMKVDIYINSWYIQKTWRAMK